MITIMVDKSLWIFKECSLFKECCVSVLIIMALILGHSQVKYMHEYLVSDKIVTLCYPGYQIRDFLDIDLVAEMVPSFPVSTIFIYLFIYVYE